MMERLHYQKIIVIVIKIIEHFWGMVASLEYNSPKFKKIYTVNIYHKNE